MVKCKYLVQNKFKTSSNAFTLVELIVVIVILAILATIAFMSFSSYSSSARDSARVSDISSIMKSIEVFSARSGTYPEPSGTITDVTYSGTILFSMGTAGESLIRTIGSLSRKPVDPLNQKEYGYSLAKNQHTKAYEISSSIESVLSYNISNPFHDLNHAFAETTADIAYIKGKYNGIILRAFTGNVYYGITSPTISLSENHATGGSIDMMSLSGKLLYNNKADSGISFTPEVVWTGSALILTKTRSFMDSIQNSFSTLSSESAYSAIVNSSGSAELDSGRRIFADYMGGSVDDSTFTISHESILVGQVANITDNCTDHPDSYSSSDSTVAMISGNMISGKKAGIVSITASGGNCAENSAKTLAVTVPLGCGSSFGKMVSTNSFTGYLCSPGYTAGSYSSNTGGTNTPSDLTWTCTSGTGNIVNCSAPFGNNGGTCDTYDMLIGTFPSNYQVWASCNLGASVAYYSGATVNSLNAGRYFQWGEMYGWDFSNGTGSANNNYFTDGSAASSPSPLTSWQTAVTDTLSGGIDRWYNGPGGDLQGPCPEGYHVPTYHWPQPSEWSKAKTILGDCYKLIKGLKLPMSGSRSRTNGALSAQTSGNYWSSSPLYDSTILSGLVDNPAFSNSCFGGYNAGVGRINAQVIRCISD